MHDIAQMKPIARSLSKADSQAALGRLRYCSVREVDVMKRAFIFRAHKVGITNADIARMCGCSHQRIGQVLANIREEFKDLAYPVDEKLLVGDYRVTEPVLNTLSHVQPRTLWMESEQFRYAMLRLVGYRL